MISGPKDDRASNDHAEPNTEGALSFSWMTRATDALEVLDRISRNRSSGRRHGTGASHRPVGWRASQQSSADAACEIRSWQLTAVNRPLLQTTSAGVEPVSGRSISSLSTTANLAPVSTSRPVGDTSWMVTSFSGCLGGSKPDLGCACVHPRRLAAGVIAAVPKYVINTSDSRCDQYKLTTDCNLSDLATSGSLIHNFSLRSAPAQLVRQGLARAA